MVELAAFGLRSRPGRPAVCRVDDEGMRLALELGLHGLFLLQIVQVLEEQHPGGLLGVVQLRGAARLLPEHVIDVFEGLFEHRPLPARPEGVPELIDFVPDFAGDHVNPLREDPVEAENRMSASTQHPVIFEFPAE